MMDVMVLWDCCDIGDSFDDAVGDHHKRETSLAGLDTHENTLLVLRMRERDNIWQKCGRVTYN